MVIILITSSLHHQHHQHWPIPHSRCECLGRSENDEYVLARICSGVYNILDIKRVCVCATGSDHCWMFARAPRTKKWDAVICVESKETCSAKNEKENIIQILHAVMVVLDIDYVSRREKLIAVKCNEMRTTSHINYHTRTDFQPNKYQVENLPEEKKRKKQQQQQKCSESFSC